MPVEVYSTVKPASRVRAWATASLLLIVAGSLAASLTRSGSGHGVFGDRIEPQEWDITFHPPAMFQQVDSSPDHFSSTYRFQHVRREGDSVELVFWRVRAQSGATPLTVCRDVLDSPEPWLSILFRPRRTRTEAPIGDRNGLEVHNPAIPMVVRALVLENGWAYAVSIRVRGAPFDEPLYRLFDLTCRAVRFKTH
jgi:hypothetical protein